MKGARTRSTAVALLLALTFFLSIPAFPVEDPWDVDVVGGSSRDGKDPQVGDGSVGVADSSLSIHVADATVPTSSRSNMRSEWWQTTVVKISYKMVLHLTPRSHVQKYRAR